jgi:hypothetical protein
MTLAELILEAKGDRSYEHLSQACGGTPTSKRLHQIATRPMLNFPDPDTICGLAQGLGVAPVDVVLAAAESMSLVDDARPSDHLSLAGLDVEQRSAVRQVVRAFAR